MKQFLAAAVMAISLAPSGAFAQERVGDAALGGLSGAILLGPVGAVAGVVVGFTAGPAISRSWGLRRPAYRYGNGYGYGYGYGYAGRTAQRAAAARANDAASTPAAAGNASPAPANPASGTQRTWDSPPVQGFE